MKTIALIPTLSQPEPHGSMTGTREWEYIKYPKPIVSLENFSRINTSITTIIISAIILKTFLVSINIKPHHKYKS